MKKIILAASLLIVACTSWAQTDWVRGTVVKVDRPRKIVTIDHEAIKSGKPGGGTTVELGAMSMPFKVQDVRLLKGVKAGDKVRFVAVMKKEDIVITHLQVGAP